MSSSSRLLLGALAVVATAASTADMAGLYSMSARTLAGSVMPLSQLSGRVLFITNVASR